MPDVDPSSLGPLSVARLGFFFFFFLEVCTGFPAGLGGLETEDEDTLHVLSDIPCAP